MATFISNNPVETEGLGRSFAAEVSSGMIVALRGELGAGKTRFVKGLVAGLGSDTSVTSPTFTLVHEYGGGRLPVYHFDFFRLQDRQAALNIGLDEYFFGDGVSVVEWADRFPQLIPESARWLDFDIMAGEQRRIDIR